MRLLLIVVILLCRPRRVPELQEPLLLAWPEPSGGVGCRPKSEVFLLSPLSYTNVR